MAIPGSVLGRKKETVELLSATSHYKGPGSQPNLVEENSGCCWAGPYPPSTSRSIMGRAWISSSSARLYLLMGTGCSTSMVDRTVMRAGQGPHCLYKSIVTAETAAWDGLETWYGLQRMERRLGWHIRP